MKSQLLEPQVSFQGSPEMAPPDSAAPLPQFSVSVPPSWVFLTEIDTQDPDPEAPVSLLLVDEQVHVDNDARYFRSVRLLKTTAAVTTESQVSIDFDPKTDRLALHSVAICRGGDRREMAQLEHFRVIQRETNLERLSYHGTLSAVCLLEDVRVGDAIDVAFTITKKPDFVGKRARFVNFGNTAPIGTYSKAITLSRELAAEIQTLTIGEIADAELRESEDELTYRWIQQHPAPVKLEHQMPITSILGSRIQISTWNQWSEVAAAFARLWNPATPATDTGLVRQQVDTLFDATDSTTSYAAKACDFVQNEIRYMSIAEGMQRYIPEPPERVLARRFGDCKDKSLLLCKLLSAVGIEAFPVLVSSVYRSETVRFLPAPNVFNHVIVAFQLEGELVWIDPTATCQGGRLQQRHLPRYVCGLVVHPGTESLCEIPEQGPPSSSHLVERFELSRTPSGLVNLSICHTFTGVEADGLRSELNTFGATAVKDAFKEMMLKRFPDAKRIDTIEISDDLESNTIKVNDSYRMAAEQFPQSGGQYHFPIHLITDNIPTTEEARLYPLALPFPRDVIHEISVDVPYAFDAPQSGEKVSSGPGFEFEHVTKSRSGGITFRCRYRTTCSEIAPEQIKDYLTALQQVTTACCVEAPLSATARQEQLVEKGRKSAQAYYAAGGHDHDPDGVPLGPGGMNWRAFLAVILVLKTLYHFVLNR